MLSGPWFFGQYPGKLRQCHAGGQDQILDSPNSLFWRSTSVCGVSRAQSGSHTERRLRSTAGSLLLAKGTVEKMRKSEQRLHVEVLPMPSGNAS